MELEVLDSLEALGFQEIKLDESNIESIILDNVLFSKILAWITGEMKAVTSLEECVTAIENPNDISSFQMDLSSLLKELGCTYSLITEGSINERFCSSKQRFLTLSFLTSELQSMRIITARKPKENNTTATESEAGKQLRELCQTIGLSKPPNSVDVKSLFSKIEERQKQIQGSIKPTAISYKPAFTGVLTAKQWKELETINKQLNKEYQLRREMLLKRLDVTIQSFHWSEKLGDKKQLLTDAFRKLRSEMSDKPNVNISQVLSARNDILYNEKTSSGSARENTKSAINDFLIGKVPDRGGRPDECQPPPPEMPPWQQRTGPPAASGSVGWIPNRGGRGVPPRGRGNYQGDRGHGGYQGHQDGGYQRDHGSQRGGYYQQGGGDQRGSYRGGRGASRVQGGWSH